MKKKLFESHAQHRCFTLRTPCRNRNLTSMNPVRSSTGVELPWPVTDAHLSGEESLFEVGSKPVCHGLSGQTLRPACLCEVSAAKPEQQCCSSTSTTGAGARAAAGAQVAVVVVMGVVAAEVVLVVLVVVYLLWK